ncbi:MAG: peptidylprolyl isomerase [Caulobacter sp.]|nr:peptidylprolyl isomerase [Caulobacter sp.]
MTRLALAAATALSLGFAPMVQAQVAPVPGTTDAALAEVTEAAIGESVAAVVNDDIISTYDLVQRMRLLSITAGIQPDENTLPQLQREAMRSLIEERLQIQELRKVEKEHKAEIIATDADVDAELADVAKGNNMTADQMLAQLRSAGVGPETLREQIRAEVSWQGYIRGRYGSRLRIGQDQIKAVQEQLTASAGKPQYQISEVVIDPARVGGLDNAVQGAGQLIVQIQQGAPFPAVARQFSSAATAANGGDAGWVGAGEMPAEVEQALEQLRPGQISRPIVTDDGVYIIALRDKRAGSNVSLVSLKQAAVPLAADASPAQVQAAATQLETLRPLVTGCADLEAKAADVQGVMAGDLGEAEVAGLIEGFQTAVATTPDGQLSQAIRTNAGLHMIMVCGRRQSGAQIPTAQQIESRLVGQQLSMISRRLLRDLRGTATIEQR